MSGHRQLVSVYGSRPPADMKQDPRVWNRNEVAKWLQWCQEEFDLPSIDINQFQMNGKALCLLMKTDFNERAPKAGDVLYNAVHLLLLQASVSDETERHHHRYNNNNNNHHIHHGSSGGRHGTSYPVDNSTGGCILQNDVSNTGSWATAWPFVSSDYHNVGHVLHQPRYNGSLQTSGAQGGRVEGTVILSPAPSIDSANSGSPAHHEDLEMAMDDERPHSREAELHCDSIHESSESELGSPLPASQVTPTPLSLTKPKKAHLANGNGNSPSPLTNAQPPYEQPVTNGRLLWDFLHQLLNDPSQRYCRCISWKEKDTGVFKIVDPHGLAQLWGMQKNHLNMNFDKMSRALRYYYRVNILKKVQGERHCYQFLRQPVELKACKQRALLNRYSLSTKYQFDKPALKAAVVAAAADSPPPTFKQESP